MTRNRVILLCVGLAHAPLLVSYGRDLWTRPHYQFYPLALAFAAWATYRILRDPLVAREQPAPDPADRRTADAPPPHVDRVIRLALRELAALGGAPPQAPPVQRVPAEPRTEPRPAPQQGAVVWGEPRRPGVLVVSALLSVAVLGLAVLLGSPWLAALSAIAWLGIWGYGTGGASLVRALLPVWILLALLIRPPLDLDQQLVNRLQVVTSAGAGLALDGMGITHHIKGNLIEVPGRTMFVEEACSGVNSLLTLIACVICVFIWRRFRFRRAIALIPACVVWVLCFNVVRVTIIVVAWSRWGWQIDVGWPHEALGVALFVGALLATLSTHCLLGAFMPHRWLLPVWPCQGQPAATSPAYRMPAWVGVPFALLIVALWQVSLQAAGPELDVARIGSLGEGRLPATWGGWKRTRFSSRERSRSSIYGRYSQTWRYDAPLHIVRVSLDYPFTSWHGLGLCYEGWGWQIDRQTVRPFELSGLSGRGDLMLLDMSRPESEQHGLVLWVAFDAQRELLRMPQNRLTSFERRLQRTDRRTVFNCQVYIEGYSPLTEEERDAAVKLLTDSLRRMLSDIELAEGR